ncbi:MAG: UvrD-helicase domain-containing protein, partial [Armatimonadetes bacterium]|nr:UvrD-helicase domain-containing protein [Candidatus Hippobium faecium]
MNEDKLKNTVVNASAGCGKTYTICEKVINRIKLGYDIRDFVIMTYTEKAAGELVCRIRNRLKEEKTKNISEKEKEFIGNALTDFDFASISTIHSFCRNILSEYAFECGVPYDMKITDFKKYVRTAFVHSVLTDSASSLALLPDDGLIEMYSENVYKSGTRDAIEKIVSQYKRGDIILPSDDMNISRMAQDVYFEIKTFLGSGIAVIKNFIQDNKPKGTRKDTLQKAYDYIDLMNEKFNKDPMTEHQIITALLEFAKIDLTTGLIKILNMITEEVHIYFIRIYKFAELYVSYIKGTVVRNTQSLYSEYLRDNKVTTFNDMITKTADCLEKNEELVKELQKRWKVGIIDEFQDTTPQQWRVAKKIFLERIIEDNDSEKPPHLIIVGDEKQSIYSFQGANVETYRTAKDYILREKDGYLQTLNKNWRTGRELLDYLNIIFSKKLLLTAEAETEKKEKKETVKLLEKETDVAENQMAENAYDINYWFDYENVEYPDEKDSSKELNIGNMCPLNLFAIEISEDKNNLNAVPNVNIAKYKYANYISNEIIKLRKRGIPFGEMCVLVREKNREGSVLENVFNEFRIPYTYYKNKGLYNSVEGNELWLLLRALAYPAESRYLKEILLTRFFFDRNILNINVPETEFYETEKLLEKWRDCFSKFGFYYMMETVFRDTEIFENLLKFDNSFYEKTPYDPVSGERSIANIRQIVKKLNESPDRPLTLMEYFKCLSDMRAENTDEEVYEECDTEKDKVRIMTMHASKGPEFNVVFIFGGWKKYTHRSPYFDIITGENKIYSFGNYENVSPFVGYNAKTDAKTLYDAEQIEEIKRLFYVAFTRARSMLYIPFITGGDSVLSSLIRRGIDLKTLTDKRYDIVTYYSEAGDKTVKHKYSEDTTFARKPDWDVGEAKTVQNFSERKREIYSFSRLETMNTAKLRDLGIAVSKKNITETEYNSDNTVSVEGLNVGSAYDEGDYEEIPDRSEVKTVPGGIHYGNMFHEIFENIDFSNIMAFGNIGNFRKAQESESNETYIINEICRKYGLNEEFYDNVRRIVWNTLHTPLFGLNKCIGDIEVCYKELPFNMFWKKNNNEGLYMSGIIDMVFRMNGKIYILDWKSNKNDTGIYSENAV